MSAVGAAAAAAAVLLGALAALRTTAANPVGISSTVTYATDVTYRKPAAVCPAGAAVYAAGEEVPGRAACERCACTADGSVSCARRACEPRPGCKALHRPDECCPTYQCECEQDGRVYDNGEKLLDPADPCKVCYCQGGEVVCRRIACFLRDDCEARAVPGRCCPEYDHCPLRGASTEPEKMPGISTSVATAIVFKKSENIAQNAEEHVKKEITIKEVTPVSEMPAFSGIRIKEIVPSPVAEVSNFIESTSKSHLIQSEMSTKRITTIAAISNTQAKIERMTESPILKIGDKLFSISNGEMVQEIAGASTAATVINIDGAIGLQRGDMDEVDNSSRTTLQVINTTKQVQTPSASQTSFTLGAVTQVSTPAKVTTNKPVTPDEDNTAFETGNPAFPPIPDDFEFSNHEETDVSSESHTDYSHVIATQQTVAEIANPIAKSAMDFNTEKEFSKILPDVFPIIKNTSNNPNEVTQIPEQWLKFNDSVTTEREIKNSPLLNLRSALPSAILNLPSALPEIITGESDVAFESPSTITSDAIDSDLTTQAEETTFQDTDDNEVKNLSTSTVISISTINMYSSATEKSVSPIIIGKTTAFYKNLETTLFEEVSVKPTTDQLINEATSPNFIEKSIASEVDDFNESSSDSSTNVKITQILHTGTILSTNPPKVTQIIGQEEIVTTPNNILEIEGTTEIPTRLPASAYGYTTDSVHTDEDVDIQNKASVSQQSRNSALIKGIPNKNNVLTDLINLVGAVASIGNSTEEPKTEKSILTFSDSEGLIPVYENPKKSQTKKGSVNSNTILEPFADKATTGRPDSSELKEIEITDDETNTITDSTLPNNKVEPTTRRPIIDNVSDTQSEIKTDIKDIEIITKSYVPTLNRRPTKVVMKINSEKAERVEASPEVSNTTSIALDVASEVASDSASPPSRTAPGGFIATVTETNNRLYTAGADSPTTSSTASK